MYYGTCSQDFKFDCDDFEAIFQPILYKDMDGNIKVKAGVHNMAQEVDKIFKSCLKFGNMWSRKIRAELGECRLIIALELG